MAVFFTRRGKAPSLGKRASDYAVGESVFLNVNGTSTEFLVVNQGIPSGSSLYDSSCDGTWLLMKDIYESRKWNNNQDNDYKNSSIHSYLNSDFLGLFDTSAQSAIKQVKIPYVNGTGGSGAVASGANGLVTKFFLLSGFEVGFTKLTDRVFSEDGAKLSYFVEGNDFTANAKRVANLNGTATRWWLRSPYTMDDIFAMCSDSNGDYAYDYTPFFSYGVRPAVIIDSSAKFDPNTNTIV